MNEPKNKSSTTERDIFLDAIDIADPSEREVFLTKACDGNSGLRASVEALLANHKEDAFMQTVFSPLNTAVLSQSGREEITCVGEAIGDRLGIYKILQKIGEGGVGVVYLAEQEVPVRRRVAVKVLKPGLETKSVMARFKSESQALALMDHPHIARVLDAGSTKSGRPFFVMDLVRGTRITDYCDEHELSTRERLSLFVQVCQAVQHAHQKGVIHRDIKPSNVLVTRHDGIPVPKVIDFGIAKAIEQKLTDQTVLTEFHSFMGTPAYVSPEQAEMSGLDIDTRADIYSLGVLLYELLTGKTPFDPGDLAASGLDGMRRTIRESEPMKPSTKIRTMQAVDQTRTASRQRLEPSKLTSLLQGDLDWIILKALEKDRTRRYETANALAMDIGRYLSNQPVLARPPSLAYRMRKWIRRNKAAAAVVVAFGAALSIGLCFTTWQWMEKSEAYQRIALSEKNEINLRKQATVAREMAEAQALVNKRRAYASDMNLTHQALQFNNLGRAQALLERYVPDNRSARTWNMEPDFRGWEWRYLWEQCRSDALFDLCQVSGGIVALSTSHDGHWVAIGKEAGSDISVWDLRSRERVLQLDQAQVSASFQFSPTHPLLAFVAKKTVGLSGELSSESVVHLWDGESRQIAGTLPLKGRCAAMAFAKDGSRFITVTDNLMVTHWDANSFMELETRRLGSGSIPPGRFGFGPSTLSGNLEFLAHAMGGGKIRVLNLSTGETLWQTKAANHFISILAGTGRFRKWDLESGTELESWNMDTPQSSASVMFSPSGQWALQIFGERAGNLRDMIDGTEKKLNMDLRQYGRGEFSPDDRFVTLVSALGVGKVWETKTGKLAATLRGFLQGQHSATFSPSSARMAIASNAREAVKLYDTDGFLELLTLEGKGSLFMSVGFSPDGNVLASCNWDGALHIWQVPPMHDISKL